MRKLVLVRHSAVAVESNVLPVQWRLSETGRARCIPLADMLAEYAPTAIVASDEPKAVGTAEIVARRLGLSLETSAGLREHDRTGAPYHGDTGEFERAVANLFAQSDKLVFGHETANDAQQRFATAVEDVLARHTHGNVVVVAHGTVITLFVARHNSLNPYEYWRRLGLPSFASLSVPTMKLLDTVAHVESDQ